MNTILRYIRNATAFQVLVAGYILVTLTAALLLSLPISSAEGKHQSFVDALFVATSGISTTGLSVVDIGKFYNTFGQCVLLCDVQIGGIGYMTLIMFAAYLLGMKLSFGTATVAKESLSGPGYHTLGGFFRNVILFTLIFELGGAIVLTCFWLKEFSFVHALYLGIYHSVNAFCTAGFSVFSDSLMRYQTVPLVSYTIISLSIVGGIGFIVLHDLCEYFIKRVKKQYPTRLTVHSKLVLITTLAVMSAGTAVIMVSEKWPQWAGFHDKITISVFQAVSASTTDGFNTVDISAMSTTSLTIIMLLMFVGASPGSTGGGIKTSTFGLVFIFLWAQLRGRETNPHLFRRRIPRSLVNKAFGIFAWFVIIIMADMIILSATEKASYLQILFETISALGNTGLSMGITADLSCVGKIVLIITMFIGRVGPLAAGFFFVGRQKPVLYEYAAEDIFIG